MSSIVEGYNYDIFISYRQKDNKGDRWVSEFVDALKDELESTFKEEISVYFDINPHDGLLETHDVDASLKEKLKCLVFIPVISRTYCDPKSFAWEHEFIAFVEQASQDRFGLKVKLPGGNIASRVLPVQIHDLDDEDRKTCEGVLGAKLRGIEFIYKEPGIDKPLAPDDDEKKNLNNSKYRIQVVKVAHAIKEVISGLKAEPEQPVKEKTLQEEPSEEAVIEDIKLSHDRPFILSKSKIFSAIAFIALVVITAILVYSKIFKKDKLETIRDTDGKISIAVMPFENLTGDTTLNWFQRGISSLLINGLGNSSELAVCDDQTMVEMMGGMNQLNTAGISPSLSKEVARKVKARTYISGSFQGRDSTYWILVNLVNAENGNIIAANKVQGNLKSSAYLDMADSLCNEIKNYLEIKALEDNAGYELKEAYPESAEAYRFFIEGMNLVLNQNYEPGIASLKKALEIDSTFTFASFYIAYACTYSVPNQIAQAVLWTKEAYLHKERIPQKYQLWIELWNACYYSNSMEDITRYCDLLAESGINTRLLWSDLGVTYFDFLHQYEKAVVAFEKVMEINMELGDTWKFIRYYDFFLRALHKTGDHDREREIADIGLVVLPEDSNWVFYHMAICALSQGKTSEADEVLVKYLAKHDELGTPEDNLERFQGQIYEEAHILDQAEIHYRKACELNSQAAANLLYLSLFLLNNDINADEGVELINKALVILPDNQLLLQWLGWGYFKQGKYDEAVNQLETMWERSQGFNYDLYIHLQEARQVLADQSNN